MPDQVAAALKSREIVTGVTRYERITSFLMSIIITLGLVTVALGAIWAANRTWIVRTAPARIAEVVGIIEDVEGGGDEYGVLDESLEKPGATSRIFEASDAYEPDEIVADFPELERTMSAILTAVSSAMAASDQLLLEDDSGTSLLPIGSAGKGPERNLGKGPGDGGGVKRQERWEIRFPSGQTVQEYAEQLDYFGVELGAITGSRLYTVSHLAARRPQVRQSSGGPGERRLYFSWRSGYRKQVDLSLLRKAGVPLSDDVVVLQFYPFETERQLARLELDYARQRGVNDLRAIRKTRFEVLEEGGGYRFEISKQDLLRGYSGPGS